MSDSEDSGGFNAGQDLEIITYGTVIERNEGWRVLRHTHAQSRAG